MYGTPKRRGQSQEVGSPNLDPADRRMNLAKLVWYSLFTKAYAIVSARTPELRRCYLRYTWPILTNTRATWPN